MCLSMANTVREKLSYLLRREDKDGKRLRRVAPSVECGARTAVVFSVLLSPSNVAVCRDNEA